MSTARWKNFYLQQMGFADGDIPYPVYDSVTEWGVWCKQIPFVIHEKLKDAAKRSWYDEHGDDEYIPEGGLKVEAYTMEVEFGCKKLSATDAAKFGTTALADVRARVGSFLTWLRTSGRMNIYSAYTRIGRRDVRFVGVGTDAHWEHWNDGFEFLVFKVQLKVNDPITDVVLSPSSSSSSSSY